jgi:hypothetical protein
MLTVVSVFGAGVVVIFGVGVGLCVDGGVFAWTVTVSVDVGAGVNTGGAGGSVGTLGATTVLVVSMAMGWSMDSSSSCVNRK